MVTTDTPISVIRRVGGLEVVGDAPLVGQGVIRRVGGLEVIGDEEFPGLLVIRRVGGLEGLTKPLRLSGKLSAV